MNQRHDDTNGWGLDITRREVAASIPPALGLLVLFAFLFYVFLSQ